MKLRAHQRKALEELNSRNEKWLFVDAPTGSGKTLVGIVWGQVQSARLNSPVVFFVRTRNQVSSFVRDFWNFYGYLPSVLLARSVVCRFIRGDYVIEDLELLPSCSACRYAKATEEGRERIRRWVIRNIDRGVYDPYAMNYPSYACPFVWWLMEGKERGAFVGTYAWLFNKYLRSVFATRVGADRVVGVVDEAHNLDEFVIDVVASLSVVSWGRVLDVCSGLGDVDSGLVRLLVRRLSLLETFIGSLRHEVMLDNNDALFRRVHDALRPVLALKERYDSLANALLEKALTNPAKPENQKRFILSRRLKRLAEFIENYVSWLEGNETLRIVAYPQNKTLKIYSLSGKNVFNQLSRTLLRGLFLSGTMPPFEYVKGVWGFPEDDSFFMRVTLRGFGRVEWKVVKGVCSRYVLRSDSMYRRFGEVVLRECSGVDGVCLVVFPSYSFMQNVLKTCDDRARKKMNVIVEERGTSVGDVVEKVKRSGRAVIFSVAGGKLCEGVELVSNGRSLIRKVVVCGVPYEAPSKLIEEFLEVNGIDKWLFINTRAYMKVRQALGRAVRFRSDSACFVLVDDRYLSDYWVSAFGLR